MLRSADHLKIQYELKVAEVSSEELQVQALANKATALISASQQAAANAAASAAKADELNKSSAEKTDQAEHVSRVARLGDEAKQFCEEKIIKTEKE